MANLPVVAQGISGLKESYPEWFDVAGSHDEFIQLCREKLEKNMREKKLLREFVCRRSWRTVALSLEQLLNDLS